MHPSQPPQHQQRQQQQVHLFPGRSADEADLLFGRWCRVARPIHTFVPPSVTCPLCGNGEVAGLPAAASPSPSPSSSAAFGGGVMNAIGCRFKECTFHVHAPHFDWKTLSPKVYERYQMNMHVLLQHEQFSCAKRFSNNSWQEALMADNPVTPQRLRALSDPLLSAFCGAPHVTDLVFASVSMPMKDTTHFPDRLRDALFLEQHTKATQLRCLFPDEDDYQDEVARNDDGKGDVWAEDTYLLLSVENAHLLTELYTRKHLVNVQDFLTDIGMSVAWFLERRTWHREDWTPAFIACAQKWFEHENDTDNQAAGTATVKLDDIATAIKHLNAFLSRKSDTADVSLVGGGDGGHGLNLFSLFGRTEGGLAQSNEHGPSSMSPSAPPVVATAATTATPSRFVTYRKRKQQQQQQRQQQPHSEFDSPVATASAAAIRPRLTSAQLDAIEANAPEDRSPADNRALRDRRKNRNRMCKRTYDDDDQAEGEGDWDYTATDGTAEAAALASASVVAMSAMSAMDIAPSDPSAAIVVPTPPPDSVVNVSVKLEPGLAGEDVASEHTKTRKQQPAKRKRIPASRQRQELQQGAAEGVSLIKMVQTSIRTVGNEEGQDCYIFNQDGTKIEVRPSKLVPNQQGLFSCAPVIKDHVITWYTGRLYLNPHIVSKRIRTADASGSMAGAYFFDVSVGGRIVYYIDGFEPDATYGGLDRCMGTYLNHHRAHANTYFEVLRVQGQQGIGVHRVAIRAARNIAAEEELLVDYGDTYHDQLIERGVLRE